MRRGGRKQAFERRDGHLTYRLIDEEGKKGFFSMPGWVCGEPVPAADRAPLLAEIAGDDAHRARCAMQALADVQSAEVLEQLLIALAKRTIAAPMQLVRYVEDPRVQTALLDAVLSVPVEDLANFAQALGLVGGPGARAALQARMVEALSHPQAFEPDSFFNFVAGAAAICAERLLYLDPEAQDAADALIRLTSHACGFNKSKALRAAAVVLERHDSLRTGALRTLRAALTALIDTPDDDLFHLVAPPFWQDARVQARVSRLFASRVTKTQLVAVGVARKVGEPALPSLIEWATKHANPLVVLKALWSGVRLLPEARRVQIAAAGLADRYPSIRYEAASLLTALRAGAAAKLARRALVDEPDPALRAKLGAFAKTPTRRSTPARSKRASRRR